MMVSTAEMRFAVDGVCGSGQSLRAAFRLSPLQLITYY